MAEKADLKSVQCGFESRGRHMNRYELRYIKTPSLPVTLDADRYSETNSWFKFFITVESKTDELVFMVQANEILSLKVTKDAG